MKFGKGLRAHLTGTLPDWRDKYICYKQLKKRLNLISNSIQRLALHRFFGELAQETPSPSPRPPPPPPQPLHPRTHPRDALLEDSSEYSSPSTPSSSFSSSVNDAWERPRSSSASSHNDPPAQNSPRQILNSLALQDLTAEEADFIRLLNAELEKFNDFFLEKEEEFIIRLQELTERIEKVKKARARSDEAVSSSEADLTEEMMSIRKKFVSIHGEMVLLENYSNINYTGLAKILKKHDRRTGAFLRMPFIQNVLQQPFFMTGLLSKLVGECEKTLQSLFPATSSSQEQQKQSPGVKWPSWVEERQIFQGEDFEAIYKSTTSALQTLVELRKGSSTYSIFSMPPNGDAYNICGNLKNASPCCATLHIHPKV